MFFYFDIPVPGVVIPKANAERNLIFFPYPVESGSRSSKKAVTGGQVLENSNVISIHNNYKF